MYLKTENGVIDTDTGIVYEGGCCILPNGKSYKLVDFDIAMSKMLDDYTIDELNKVADVINRFNTTTFMPNGLLYNIGIERYKIVKIMIDICDQYSALIDSRIKIIQDGYDMYGYPKYTFDFNTNKDK